MAVSFIGGRKPEYPVETTDLSQETDDLYHITFALSTTHHERGLKSQL